MPRIVPQSILIILAVIAAVPTNFAIVWYEEGSVVFEFDRHFELLEDQGDDFVFAFFRILDGEGVVVLHHEDGVAGGPDVEHGLVDDVGKGALGVVGDCFAEGGLVVASAPELSLSSCEGNKSSSTSEGGVDVGLPLEVGGVGSEVLWLEVFDDGDWKFGLCR